MKVETFAVAAEYQFRTRDYLQRVGGLSAIQDFQVMGRATGTTGPLPDVMATAIEQSAALITDRGDTYYVSADVVDMIGTVKQSLPANWQLRDDRHPSAVGFCYLDASAIPHAIGWMTHEGEGSTLIMMFAKEANYFIPSLTLQWKHGSKLERAIEDAKDPDVSGILSFFAALIEFMNDKILVTRTERLPRASRRRVQAMTPSPIDPTVKVVELRVRQYETIERECESHSREYSCQWFVRGHWRQQWYPSLGTHQPKWITPYVKGPDDKPLKTPSANVFAVVR